MPTFSGATAGTYTFTLTVTDTYSCTSTDVVVVTVDPAPTASAGLDKFIGDCAAQSTSLNGSGTGTGISYSWSPSTYLNNAALPVPTFSGATVGTYTLTLTVTDTYSCTATDVVVVTVVAAPVADAGTDQIFCADAVSTTLSGCGSEGAGLGCEKSPLIGPHGTYSWSPILPAGVLTPTNTVNTTVDISKLSVGLNTFTLTVTDIYGCTSTDDVVITIVPLPTVTCPGPFTVCNTAGSFNMFDLGAFTPDETGYFTEGTASPTSTFNPVTAGSYTHTITYHYSNGTCENTNTFTIYVDPMGEINLAGQVKYWNNAETYMPTPFPTDLAGLTPPDYFYVALYRMDLTFNAANPLNPTLSPAFVDWEKVDQKTTEIWDPNFLNPDLTLGAYVVDSNFMSFFKFGTKLDPTKEYFVTVWDGSNLYEEWLTNPAVNPVGMSYNNQLGATYTWNNWGGVSALDAYAMQLMANQYTQLNDPSTYNWNWIGNKTYASDKGYGFYTQLIANVNNSQSGDPNGVTTLDALLTQNRVAGLQKTFPANVGNFQVAGRFVNTLPQMTFPATGPLSPWDKNAFTSGHAQIDLRFVKNAANYTYYTPAVANFYKSDAFSTQSFLLAKNTGTPTLGGCPVAAYINVYYEATGDVNASYVPPTPGFKAEPAMTLVYENEVVAQKGEIIDIPVSVDRSANLGSIDLGLTFRKDLVKVMEVPGYDVVNIDNENGFVRLSYADVNGKSVNTGDAIVSIKVQILTDITSDTRVFELEAMTELGSMDAQVIKDINLKTVAISTSKPSGNSDMFVGNYPNPFNNKTTISYNLPEDGRVSLVVYNKLGAVVTTLLDQVQSAGSYTFDLNRGSLAAGVYTYRLILKGKDTHTATRNMVITE